MGCRIPHVPTPGRRPLLAYQLLPIISIILYYTARFTNYDPQGKGLLPIIYDNASAFNDSGDYTHIQAVRFLSSPLLDTVLNNVSIIYMENYNGEACTASNIPTTATVNGTFKALAITALRTCYPEDIARNAKSVGFDAVLYKGVFRSAGWSALSIWRENNAPIPVFELNANAPIKNILLADLSTSDNPLRERNNFIVMTFMASVAGFFGILQLVIAIERLREMHNISTMKIRFFVCVLQLGSGMLRLFFAFDMCGYFHYFAYPFFLMAITVGVVFAFGTILSVGAIFHFALIVSEGRKIIFNKCVWFLAFCILSLIGFMVFMLLQGIFLTPLGTNGLVVMDGAIAVIFQVVSGAYFIRSRRTVLVSLKS
jgi:hypothetical protein